MSGCFAVGVAVLGACNALTGASDLQFDERAPAVDATPETALLGDVTVAPNDASAPMDASVDAADEADADAAPCTPTTTTESVTSSPTTFTNGTQVGSVPWVITTNNGSHVALTLAQVSNYLVGTGLGLDAMLPDTAAIQGFTVSVTRSGAADDIVDEGVALVRELVPGTAKMSALPWPDALTPIQYGSSMDLWTPSKPWTAADVRSANFGVAFAARGASSEITLARVSTVTVRVFFIRCPGP